MLRLMLIASLADRQDSVIWRMGDVEDTLEYNLFTFYEIPFVSSKRFALRILRFAQN